jgi:hypothetical protein
MRPTYQSDIAFPLNEQQEAGTLIFKLFHIRQLERFTCRYLLNALTPEFPLLDAKTY